MTDKEFNKLEQEYRKLKRQYEAAEQHRYNEVCQREGFRTISETPEDGRFIITIDYHRCLDFFKVHLYGEGWGNTSIHYWAYPEDFSEGKLNKIMLELKATDGTAYLFFKRWRTGKEFAVGDLVAWNDPAINEYDEEDRRVARNRRFVIRSIDYDAGRAFITTDFTKTEAPIGELVMLDINDEAQ